MNTTRYDMIWQIYALNRTEQLSFDRVFFSLNEAMSHLIRSVSQSSVVTMLKLWIKNERQKFQNWPAKQQNKKNKKNKTDWARSIVECPINPSQIVMLGNSCRVYKRECDFLSSFSFSFSFGLINQPGEWR